jgi:hypothetical protein
LKEGGLQNVWRTSFLQTWKNYFFKFAKLEKKAEPTKGKRRKTGCTGEILNKGRRKIVSIVINRYETSFFWK